MDSDITNVRRGHSLEIKKRVKVNHSEDVGFFLCSFEGNKKHKLLSSLSLKKE